MIARISKAWHGIVQAHWLVLLTCSIGLAVVCFTTVRSIAESQDTAKPAGASAASSHPTFLGSDTCLGCHDELTDHFGKQIHGTALMDAEKKGRGHLCEGCHGPGSVHANDPSPETGAPLKEFARSGKGCLSCHNTRISPAHWQQSEHAHANVTCIYCHAQVKPADPKVKTSTAKSKRLIPDQPILPHEDIIRKPSSETCESCHAKVRGEMNLPYHHPVKEGRIGCADCHNPHKPLGDEIKRDVCITCHVKKHGPFVFEHGAISGDLTDGCIDCHRPHGSPNQQMLKLTNRGLCLQCHADRATHFSGRRCWDCHKAVHGSNSNVLFFTE